MGTSTDGHQRPSAPWRQSAIRKVAIRLVPFVALMFFINYLDRTAIAFAGPNGMNEDLGLSAAQFGFASGVFFIGYILLGGPQQPGPAQVRRPPLAGPHHGQLGHRLPAVHLGQIVEQLYILRFILGVAEAGFFPGAILFLSLWVPSRHRSKILGPVLPGPAADHRHRCTAGRLAHQPGRLLFGLEGWRFMYLGVGHPGHHRRHHRLVLPGRYPGQGQVADPGRERLADRRARGRGRAKKDHGEHKHVSVRTAFTNGKVWMLSAIYFGFIYGLYALAFFLPTIIGGFEAHYGTKFDFFEKGLITAIPYLPAAIASVLLSQGRHEARRQDLATSPSRPSSAVSIPLALFAGSPAATIAVITITACAIFAALPNFWTVPTQFLTGAAAAAGIALINTMGNIAGFAAGYVTGWLKDQTGGYTVPMFVVGGFMLLSGRA